MTATEAKKLDDKIEANNDTLFIAYKTETCKIRTVSVWLQSEFGDNSEELKNDDYCTRSTTAEELNSFILECLHGSEYRRNLGSKLMEQLDELV